jgi:hypothetical protein
MKKAHRMLSMSLGPVGRFSFVLLHLIFILLTKLSKKKNEETEEEDKTTGDGKQNNREG